MDKSGPLPEEALQAFNALQVGLASKPLMAHPQANKDFILTTDTATRDSEHAGGMGAVLSQLHDSSSERVIAYASRGLKANDKNYSAYLLKLAAAAWAIDNFAFYLRGRRFTLFMDHKPLESLSTMHTKTLNGLQQQLLEFDFDIRYKEGKGNTAADALSRNTVAALNDDSGTLRQAQTADALCNPHGCSSSLATSGAHLKGRRRD